MRKIICPAKINTQQWIDTVTTAHKTGISTNATIMYGHVETIEERLDHVFTIREIQKETGGFAELIPMSFLPYNNTIGEKMLASGKFASTGLEDLQLIAISRIILHTLRKQHSGHLGKAREKTCTGSPSVRSKRPGRHAYGRPDLNSIRRKQWGICVSCRIRMDDKGRRKNSHAEGYSVQESGAKDFRIEKAHFRITEGQK